MPVILETSGPESDSSLQAGLQRSLCSAGTRKSILAMHQRSSQEPSLLLIWLSAPSDLARIAFKFLRGISAWCFRPPSSQGAVRSDWVSLTVHMRSFSPHDV